MGTGSLLAGCSSGTSDSGEGASQSDETPKTLRVAMMGSSTDTLDPATFSTLLPLAIALNVYDSLILLRNGVVENSLAESIEPNEDASAWTVTLKDGVKYHDGETVTAEDALYSLQYAGTSPMYSSFYANVDWEAARLWTSARSRSSFSRRKPPSGTRSFPPSPSCSRRAAPATISLATSAAGPSSSFPSLPTLEPCLRRTPITGERSGHRHG